MSQANVEIVEKAIEAFNLRDLDMLAALSDEDVEFVSVMAAVEAGSATFRGPETWTRYFETMDESWDGWRVEGHEVLDAGDAHVAATFAIVGTGRRSGAPVKHEIGVVYTLRDGRLRRLRSYADPAEALEAVGLRK